MTFTLLLLAYALIGMLTGAMVFVLDSRQARDGSSPGSADLLAEIGVFALIGIAWPITVMVILPALLSERGHGQDV